MLGLKGTPNKVQLKKLKETRVEVKAGGDVEEYFTYQLYQFVPSTLTEQDRDLTKKHKLLLTI